MQWLEEGKKGGGKRFIILLKGSRHISGYFGR
jgi:hypothetical protein